MTLTVADWRWPHYRMIWCIYNRQDWAAHTQKDFENESEEDDSYSRIRLDLTAPPGLPDGRYTAIVNLAQKGYDHGVLIRDGQFVPEAADRAVFNAMVRALGKDPAAVEPKAWCADHIFIEEVNWQEMEQVLEFLLGS